MNSTIFRLTLRQLAGSKRTWLLGIPASLLPIGLAAIYAASGDDNVDWTANVLMDGLMLTVVIPLVCLLLGTAALGTEIEDGTIVYVLARPIPRRAVVFAKAAAAALIAAIFLLPAAAIAPVISLDGESASGLALGFFIATILGIFAYTALFTLLSIVTSRALLIGLAYVFIWEGAVGDLFSGTRFMSIRQYCLAVADAFADIDEDIFSAELGAEAFVLLIGVTVLALWMAIRALSRLELRETD